MKTYISSSNTLNLPEIYNIEVVYEVPFDASMITADSEINPVYLHDGTVDKQALADYNSFLENIYACLYNRFEVVDVEESPRSLTSWYFWIYGKDSDGNVATKVLVRLRISDHEYSKRHDKRAERAYVRNKAQELKRPKSKREQDWKIAEIVIDNTRFNSYAEAEDFIYERMDRLRRELVNKGKLSQ